MKISELTGVLLDFYVAKAEGHAPKILQKLNSPAGELMWFADTLSGTLTGMRHKFSEQWELGGPIIEREKISLEPFGEGWGAGIGAELTKFYLAGPTPLVAAMRAYVASKFGEEVHEGTDIQNG